MPIPTGFLIAVLLIGIGIFVVFPIGPHAPTRDTVHIEAYPVGPEKPTPLNSSNVGDYTAAYEERLFYNDLLASHDHSFETDERVIADCTPLSVSNATSDGFDVQLECRGGVTDSSHLSESEEFTYSVIYRITATETRQTELQNYPFDTVRGFNDERK